MAITRPKMQNNVSPLLAAQWYSEKIKSETLALKDRINKIQDYPENWVNRDKCDVIDETLRKQYFLGCQTPLGLFYREKCIHKVMSTLPKTNIKNLFTYTFEHVIPVAFLRNQILSYSELKTENIVMAYLSPVALITKSSCENIDDVDINHCPEFPFKRYIKFGIQTVSHDGFDVNENWSIHNHWELLSQEQEFKEVLDYYGIS